MGHSHHVVPNPAGGWDVMRSGVSRASRHFDTKAEAVDAGREISSNQCTEFFIDRKDGTIQRKDSHGNDPCQDPRCPRPVAALTGEGRVLDSYVGVTAALNGRFGGKRWQKQKTAPSGCPSAALPPGGRLGRWESRDKGASPCRSGVARETTGATYIPKDCRLTHPVSPISFPFSWLRPNFRTPVAEPGSAEVDGSDPPVLPPGSVRRRGATYICAAPPRRVAPVPSIPADCLDN